MCIVALLFLKGLYTEVTLLRGLYSKKYAYLLALNYDVIGNRYYAICNIVLLYAGRTYKQNRGDDPPPLLKSLEYIF